MRRTLQFLRKLLPPLPLEVFRSDDDGPAIFQGVAGSGADDLTPTLRVLHWTARDV